MKTTQAEKSLPKNKHRKRVGPGGTVRGSLSDLWEDFKRAQDEWLAHYRSIPKYGRTRKQAYKDNGLWTRYKNRERKFNAAYYGAPAP